MSTLTFDQMKRQEGDIKEGQEEGERDISHVLTNIFIDHHGERIFPPPISLSLETILTT